LVAIVTINKTQKKPNISSGKRGREKESMALNNMAKLKTALRMLKEPMDSPH